MKSLQTKEKSTKKSGGNSHKFSGESNIEIDPHVYSPTIVIYLLVLYDKLKLINIISPFTFNICYH